MIRSLKWPCSSCGKLHSRTGQRYCGDCHAAYMRAWRKTHPRVELRIVESP